MARASTTLVTTEQIPEKTEAISTSENAATPISEPQMPVAVSAPPASMVPPAREPAILEAATRSESWSGIRAMVATYPLFAPLAESIQDQIAGLLNRAEYTSGQTIFQYNDPGNAMYFLCHGKVRFETRWHNGSTVVLEEIEAGDLFGEVALYSGGQRAAAAVCTEDASALILRKPQLNEFLRTCPEVSQYLLQRMATRLASSNRLLRRAALSVDEAVDASRSAQDRAVKSLVERIATVPMLNAHLIFIALWVFAKIWLGERNQLETSSFEILAFVLGVEALLVSMLVLINQIREAKEESVRDKTEYEATLHADGAINYLHEKIDALSAEVRNLTENLHR